jgi:hypothetical protein
VTRRPTLRGVAGAWPVLGGLNLPLIHWSVYWFRSLQRESLDLLPQSGPDAFRGELFVFLAFAAAWLGIALSALSIGGKRSRLARAMKEDGGAAPGDPKP